MSIPPERQNVQVAFLYNPPGVGNHCHGPTIVETHNGDLFAAWYAYPEEEHKDASLILASRRQGETGWSEGKVLFTEVKYSVGNPVLFQEPGGRLCIYFVLLKGRYWTESVPYQATSDDEGRIWSPPRPIWKEKGMMLRHPPILLQNESLLFPCYREKTDESCLLSSPSPYKTWHESYNFSDHALIQPVLIRDSKSSSIVLFFRPAGESRSIWRSHSNDEGRTWASPVRTPLPNPLSGIGAFSHNGRIGLVYNHTTDHQRHPLSVAVSENGGLSWSPPRHIETIHYEVSYPSFSTSRDNGAHGVYTYNRRMIKYVYFSEEELHAIR